MQKKLLDKIRLDIAHNLPTLTCFFDNVLVSLRHQTFSVGRCLVLRQPLGVFSNLIRGTQLSLEWVDIMATSWDCLRSPTGLSRSLP